MKNLVTAAAPALVGFGSGSGLAIKLPVVIAHAGPRARLRFAEFFTVHLRNPNTRQAYFRAILRFCAWCDVKGIRLRGLRPMMVAAYVEELGRVLAAPSVIQHLAAIRVLCDWFVLGQVLPMNPTAAVRAPKHVVKHGKTPILTPKEARQLLDSIPAGSVIELRDRALIGTMLFAFSRVSAAVGLQVRDYRRIGERRTLRLHEKGGKFHEVPVHRELRRLLEDYLIEAQLPAVGPLFPSSRGRSQVLTRRPMGRGDALRMIKRRAAGAGLPESLCCHSFRGTGVTAYLAAGGTIETAQAMAGHESAQTTKLYDRNDTELTSEEIERVAI